ncbi:MAG: SMC-Scp complex subunit ScpB [Bacillota bacterium]
MEQRTRLTDRRKQLGAVEACLFAAPGPLSVEEMAEAVQVQPDEMEALLYDLRERYDVPGSGVQLLAVAGGYQLRTRVEYASMVERILTPRSEQLSAAALETLALIAYRQPITRPEIDHVRGVSTSHLLRRLTDEGLIRVVGRKDVPGRPKIYRTTERFLEQFGLKSLESLPPLPELTDPGDG